MRMILVAGAFAIATTVVGANRAAADSGLFTAELGRTQEYVGANARGHAKFRVSSDGRELHYELTAESLENFTQAHIHLTPDALTQESLIQRFAKSSPKGEHGPLVAFLTDFMRKGITVDGALAEGVIRGSDLVGPLKGYPLAVLTELMHREDAYVALHTLKPIPPNNTFCCPVGLRGIIEADRSQ